MNTENIPQVGSKWLMGGVHAVEVVARRARGRGYQVDVAGALENYVPDQVPVTYRERDFLKAAKPL